MAVKRVYVSDLTGKEIEGAHKTISINKKVQKKYSYYGGRSRYYSSTEAKVFHLAEDEINLLPEAIREHLWPTPKPKKEKPAKSDKKVSA